MCSCLYKFAAVCYVLLLVRRIVSLQMPQFFLQTATLRISWFSAKSVFHAALNLIYERAAISFCYVVLYSMVNFYSSPVVYLTENTHGDYGNQTRHSIPKRDSYRDQQYWLPWQQSPNSLCIWICGKRNSSLFKCNLFYETLEKNSHFADTCNM